MVYTRKSSKVHITETKLVIREIKTQHSIDVLQRDANKVKYLTHQKKNDQINQTMHSNSKSYKKYWNAKEKLKKLFSQQTPATVVVADNLNALEKSIAKTQFTIIEIENVHLMEDLQRDATKVRVLRRQTKSDQIDQKILSNS